MVEAFFFFFFFFFLSIKRVFRGSAGNQQRTQRLKKKEKKKKKRKGIWRGTGHIDESSGRNDRVSATPLSRMVLRSGIGRFSRYGRKYSIARASARARWRKYARMSIRVHRPAIRFDIPCLCNYAPPVSKRTLIELKRIMKIWFDTAMSRERISR